MPKMRKDAIYDYEARRGRLPKAKMNCRTMVQMYVICRTTLKIGVAFPNGNPLTLVCGGGCSDVSLTMKRLRR